VSKYARRLEKALEVYDKELEQVCNAVRADLLIPFCDRHALKFTAGMGSWGFDHPNGGTYGGMYGGTYGWPSRAKLPKRLRDALELDAVSSRNDIGSLVADYTSPGYREKVVAAPRKRSTT
jgi:hypothetical protein